MTMAAMIKATGGSKGSGIPKVVLTEEEKAAKKAAAAAAKAAKPALSPEE